MNNIKEEAEEWVAAWLAKAANKGDWWGIEHKEWCADMILEHNVEVIKERDECKEQLELCKAELERLRDVVCSEDVESIDRTLGDTILTSQLKQLQADVKTGKNS
jgi:hypothetical protein